MDNIWCDVSPGRWHWASLLASKRTWRCEIFDSYFRESAKWRFAVMCIVFWSICFLQSYFDRVYSPPFGTRRSKVVYRSVAIYFKLKIKHMMAPGKVRQHSLSSRFCSCSVTYPGYKYIAYFIFSLWRTTWYLLQGVTWTCLLSSLLFLTYTSLPCFTPLMIKCCEVARRGQQD